MSYCPRAGLAAGKLRHEPGSAAKRWDARMVETRTPHERALPNYENAVIPREKLERYCLDPEHVSSTFGKSSGRDKARVFQAALGFSKAHWELLKNRILEELPYEEAIVGHEDEYGKV